MQSNPFMSLSDRMYASLKWMAVLVLPAVAVLYMALAKLWGLPYPTEVAGTVTAITVLLGMLLGISTAQYNSAAGTTAHDSVAHAFWMLTQRQYSVLKYITVLIIPAFGALYYTMARAWGFPYPNEVVGSLAAVTVFLITILDLGRITLNNKPNFLQFNDKVYTTLKWTVLQILPGIGTAYLALGKLWGWPYVSEVVTTVTAVTLFLGVILGVSTANYKARYFTEVTK